MNCTEARDRLPGLLYGDLPAPEAAAVETHLAACPACRQEYAALQRVRPLLDAAPAAAVAVDLPRLYRAASRVRARQLRRWRSAAVALGSAAAVLLLIVGLRFEVRIETHQVTLGWRLPAADTHTPPPLAPAEIHREAPAAAFAAEDVQLVKDLIRALADDVEARDQRLQQVVTWMQARLEAVRRQDQQRWDTTAREVAALSAQFGPPEKGANP